MSRRVARRGAKLEENSVAVVEGDGGEDGNLKKGGDEKDGDNSEM
jgi:hypothetical protein